MHSKSNSVAVCFSLFFLLLIDVFVYDHVVPFTAAQSGHHGHRIFLDELESDPSSSATMYEPEFYGVDRGIIGRAPSGMDALGNNAPRNLNIEFGQTQHWLVPKEVVFGPYAPVPVGLPPLTGSGSQDGPGRDQGNSSGGTGMVYVTLNVCLQPGTNGSTSGDAPPQLSLYVSVSTDNPQPGPGAPDDKQNVVPAVGGYASSKINTTEEVYVGVSAPAADETSTFTGIYNYEIAISIDAPYHSSDQADSNLVLVDSDSTSALLVTRDLRTTNDPNATVYQEWLNLTPPPFGVFVHPTNDSSVNGIQNSYCGLKKHANVSSSLAGGQVDVQMTTRGVGRKPKQQLYVRGLAGGTEYNAMLSMTGNSTSSGVGVVGGGGKVWRATTFNSKTGKFPPSSFAHPINH